MEKGWINVLLVGKGAREHSLAWKLSNSPSVKHIFVVPGNGGTGVMPKVTNINSIRANDYTALVNLGKQLNIALVVAGPDDAVVDGIEGYFRNSGIPCFAPTKEAAEIEGSKTYAKMFMKRYNIPTAAYEAFDNYTEASNYLEDMKSRVVIKVDGLAEGKGVYLPTGLEDAHDALGDIFVSKKFGPAGLSVVLEEYLEGDEVSFLCLSDGRVVRSFPPAQDHKRIFDGNKGPNTGGMGVYAPVSFLTADHVREIREKILKPTLYGLRCEGRPFKGLLFVGIMITASGPKVLEYNARFGDPETQTLMMLLAPEVDLASVLLACCLGKLDTVKLPFRGGFGCNVVIAARGYPDQPCPTGDEIELSECPEGVQIFHAGTKRSYTGKLLTAGGRIFSVAAHGASLTEAVALAYKGVASIKFKGMQYRKDIAFRELLDEDCIVVELSELTISHDERTTV